MAGKTGTTDGNKSAWFVGYTPQLSTAISMFRMDDDETNKNRKFLEMYGTGGQEKIHGASFPAEIWHDYMTQALKGSRPEDFPTPEPSARSSDEDAAARRPTPSATETEEATPTPTPTPPTESRSSHRPRPRRASTCGPFDVNCNDTGGTATGGTGGGTTDGGSDGQPQHHREPTEQPTATRTATAAGRRQRRHLRLTDAASRSSARARVFHVKRRPFHGCFT